MSDQDKDESEQVPMMQNQALGLSGLLLVMLGLSPTYEAWKLRRESLRLKAEHLRADEREARFDYWLSQQKMPMTMVLLGLIAMVAAGQVAIGWEGAGRSIGSLLSKLRACLKGRTSRLGGCGPPHFCMEGGFI